MQSNPVDNIVCKVVAQLLKEKDVEYVSETVVTSIASIMMECRIRFGLRFLDIKEVGRMANTEAFLENRSNVVIQNLLVAVVFTAILN